MTDDTIQPTRGGVFAAQDGSTDTVVRITAWPEQPVSVRQTSEQTVSFRGEVPVCIRVCEPICARSDYSIGITVFDRPVATINVSGTTRIENCGGATPSARTF
jgi:hypothetical protein